MSDHMLRYSLWQNHAYFDQATRAELTAIAADKAEIEDRFGRDLEFGTGGLRGVIGAGTNRINRYTVRLATQGLAEYVRSQGEEACRRGVVIAHDSRRFSPEFAREAALVLASNGVRAYLWDSLRPTPLLSYAVRHLGAKAGIVITASHNPPEYNGYKVYGELGGQLPPEPAAEVLRFIRSVTDITAITVMEEAVARRQGLLAMVPPEVDRTYLDLLKQLADSRIGSRADGKVLYTPLHGSGQVPVQRVLSELGYIVDLVAAQAMPDGNFPTVSYPNPEEPEVFTLALEQAKASKPDLIMATDPDADRLGVMVRHCAGEYRLLTGNQVGAILVEYLLSRAKEEGKLPKNGAVVKTIATSNLVQGSCADYGVRLVDTHTGFKFIADLIREWEQTGEHTFLFGFEESYGYLAGTFVRDKDAVMTAALAAEASAYYRQQGLSLPEVLESIWARHGYFQEALHSVTIKGLDGLSRMGAMMADLRQNPPRSFAGVPVAHLDDYSTGLSINLTDGSVQPLRLGKANVLHYRFADGGFVMVRPSGTEPKLKIYVSVRGATLSQAEGLVQEVLQAALETLKLS